MILEPFIDTIISLFFNLSPMLSPVLKDVINAQKHYARFSAARADCAAVHFKDLHPQLESFLFFSVFLVHNFNPIVNLLT